MSWFDYFFIKKKAVENYLLKGSSFEEEKNNINAINYFRSRDSSENDNENKNYNNNNNDNNKNPIVADYKKFIEEKENEKNKTNYFAFVKKKSKPIYF